MPRRPLACLLLLLAGVTGGQAASTARPNVVILLVDDLGWGDVSCLHPGAVPTPHIDRIARRGVTFSSGYATTPLCGPARAGLLSGVYPHRLGFVDNSGGIPTQQPLLPGVLRDAGYRTALIGKWHSAGPMPHARGIFDESLCSNVSSPFIDYFHPKLLRNGVAEESDEYSTDLFAREAVAFIARNRDRPFALTVTFNAPHILRVVRNALLIRKDYDAARAEGRTLDVPKVPMARPGEAARYAARFPGDTARADTVATIAALDEAVGRILDALEQHALDRRTIVFFLGDNGGHPENRSESLPLRDYKWSLYEGGIRVPFLASFPDVFPAGLKFESPVSSMDIFATCAALTGVTAPRLDGVDLTPYVTGKITTAPHPRLFFAISGIGAVREDRWKLVLPPGEPPQLFDLAADLTESRDRASAEPGQVAALSRAWKQWFAQFPPPPPVAPKKKARP